jgi:hypothetical protein
LIHQPPDEDAQLRRTLAMTYTERYKLWIQLAKTGKALKEAKIQAPNSPYKDGSVR